MACNLKHVPSDKPHTFSGHTGSSVTLEAGGGAATITSAIYAGVTLDNTLTFTIKPGLAVLLVTVMNQPGASTLINEKCNGTSNILFHFTFDDAYQRTIRIIGV